MNVKTVIGSQESLKSWAKHIVGAAALIQIRGQDQMQSDVGRRLFRFLRAQIVGGFGFRSELHDLTVI